MLPSPSGRGAGVRGPGSSARRPSSGQLRPPTSPGRRRGSRMTIIDSHCHLDFPDSAEDLDSVVARARSAGVERMITIGAKVSKAAGVGAIAKRYDDVFFTVGTHTH